MLLFDTITDTDGTVDLYKTELSFESCQSIDRSTSLQM